MTNRKHNGRRGTSDTTKVVGEAKDGPVILNGTERSVLSVWKASVVNELCTNSNVCSSLVGCANSL